MSLLTRLFVGNLPVKTTEQDLRAAFSEYGEITNIDLKTKTAEDDKRNFAFITISTSHNDVESCINHFGKYNFKDQKLYVTRARESFLERLQRERQQEQAKKYSKKEETLPKENPVINLSEKLCPAKRKVDFQIKEETLKKGPNHKKKLKAKQEVPPDEGVHDLRSNKDHKKEDADKKRLESLKKKRQEFKIKQSIIKTGLFGIDKVRNNKILFTDDDVSPINTQHRDIVAHTKHVRKSKDKTKSILDIDDSGDEINFDIKKQFEGRNGQKVLDLQSRYKSDKRFVLDERFIDDEQKEENEKQNVENNEHVELSPEDEKSKQLDILQDVLGVSLKRPARDPDNKLKNKSKMGMLRFDPSQPDHAKFLAPIEEKEEKSRKAKKKQQEVTATEPQAEQPKPEVSKEQFYKVSDRLKETIAQPTIFSLRSLFGNNEDESRKDGMEQEPGFIPLEKPKDQKKKVKNPLEPGDKNPFVYDSSDSEEEKLDMKQNSAPDTTEVKAIWKENFFFTLSDHRLQDGLAFFNKPREEDVQKERRELKSLMKRRIYNKERKNQMFQKKIGGRKKNMKKSYSKKT